MYTSGTTRILVPTKYNIFSLWLLPDGIISIAFKLLLFQLIVGSSYQINSHSIPGYGSNSALVGLGSLAQSSAYLSSPWQPGSWKHNLENLFLTGGYVISLAGNSFLYHYYALVCISNYILCSLLFLWDTLGKYFIFSAIHLQITFGSWLLLEVGCFRYFILIMFNFFYRQWFFVVVFAFSKNQVTPYLEFTLPQDLILVNIPSK